MCTITGLTPGTSYTFTVTATNAFGTGPASAPSGKVTPHAAGAKLTRAPRPPAVLGSGWMPRVIWPPSSTIQSVFASNGLIATIALRALHAVTSATPEDLAQRAAV